MSLQLEFSKGGDRRRSRYVEDPAKQLLTITSVVDAYDGWKLDQSKASLADLHGALNSYISTTPKSIIFQGIDRQSPGYMVNVRMTKDFVVIEHLMGEITPKQIVSLDVLRIEIVDVSDLVLYKNDERIVQINGAKSSYDIQEAAAIIRIGIEQVQARHAPRPKPVGFIPVAALSPSTASEQVLVERPPVVLKTSRGLVFREAILEICMSFILVTFALWYLNEQTFVSYS